MAETKGLIIDARFSRSGKELILELQVEDSPKPREYLELRKGLFIPLMLSLSTEGGLPEMSEKFLMTGSSMGSVTEDGIRRSLLRKEIKITIE